MNNKEKILKELYKAELNIPSDLLIWAASHLPDVNTEGNNNKTIVKYNHSSENIFDAIGITREDISKGEEKFKSIVKNCSSYHKTSKLFEDLIEGDFISEYLILKYTKFIVELYIKNGVEPSEDDILNHFEVKNHFDGKFLHPGEDFLDFLKHFVND